VQQPATQEVARQPPPEATPPRSREAPPLSEKYEAGIMAAADEVFSQGNTSPFDGYLRINTSDPATVAYLAKPVEPAGTQDQFTASGSAPTAPADPMPPLLLGRSHFGRNAFGWLARYAEQYPDFVESFGTRTNPRMMTSSPPTAIFDVVFNGEHCHAIAPLLPGRDTKFQIPEFAITTSQGMVTLRNPYFEHITHLDEPDRSAATQQVLDDLLEPGHFDSGSAGR
jgi:hypothetical protein